MSANWFFHSKNSQSLIDQLIELEQNWQDQFSCEELRSELVTISANLQSKLDPNLENAESLYQVLDVVYDELAFSGCGLQALPMSSLSSVSYCIKHRTGSYLSLSIVLCELLNQVGFNSYLAKVEGELGLVCQLSNSELVIIDSESGGCEYLISLDDVRESLTHDVASYIERVSVDELVKFVITDQKMFLLDEGFFEEALNCVETLMDMLPEDPYERRDRGLVLQQLECDLWAKDDFDYFIKACPNDPMVMFLKLQLEGLDSAIKTIH